MRVYIFILVVNILLSSLGYIYLHKNLPWAQGWLFNLAYLALAINTVACRALPAETPLLLGRLSAWLSGQWIALMYYIIIISLIHLAVTLISKLIGFSLPHSKLATGALITALAFIGWGTYRALQPVTRTEVISSSKLPAGQSYKVVLLTDLHLGQVLGRQYAEKLVTRVNSQSPDLIVISGDLLDEKQRYIDRENSLEPLKDFQSKYGTYMAFGNHDYLDQPESWQQRLERTNIRVLRNASIVVADQLKITGINDWSRQKGDKEIIAQASGNKNYYSILLDHQPRRMLEASKNGYDLYLAGHTHTGQLYPNRLVTSRMYLLDYGRANFGNMTAITSNGYGFWGPPVRTEEAPEMVIIEIKGK